MIAAGIASRVFRRVDPGTAARALLGAANWTVKWYRPGGERDAKQIGADFADLLVGGLLCIPTSSEPRSAPRREPPTAGTKRTSASNAAKRGPR